MLTPDDICMHLQVQVLVADRWLDGAIHNYSLRHAGVPDAWSGHIDVSIVDGLIVCVAADRSARTCACER